MQKIQYEQIATDFNDKYREFYKGNSIDEEVTQGLWHGFHLSRERLAKLGVTLDVKLVENGALGPLDSNLSQKVESVVEGVQTATMISTPVSIRRRYYRGTKKLAEITDYTSEANCLILENNNVDKQNGIREVVCPTCGAIGSRESLFDGCDFCQSKFQVNNEERKVSAFNVFYDNVAGTQKAQKNNKRLLLVCLLLLVICVGISLSGFLLRDTMVIHVALSKWAKILTFIALVNGILLFVAGNMAKGNKVERLEKSGALTQLCGATNFNFGKFTEELEYKLKSIHFAQKQNDISMFANSEVANSLSLYGNVLECQLKSCKIANYHSDEKYHYIQTKVIAVLTLLKGNRIVEKEETLEISFHKSKNAVASKSLVSYSCNGCGSSVNLLNGGKCDYCGGQLHLEEYDWVIDSYVSSEVKRKDSLRFVTKMVAIGVSVLILLLNITNIRIAAITTYRGIIDMNASVYVLNNEMIPSLENYGYAFWQSGSKKIDDGVEYRYKYADGRDHIFGDYPNHLIEENGFALLNSDDSLVTLVREKEFSKGKIYVIIGEDANREYIISIVETD